MNRYVADGILDDVMSGKTVLLVTDGGHASRAALYEIEERAARRCLEGIVEVRRANGQESIRHASGGRVMIVPVRGHGGRGMSADVVFVDALDMTADRLAELMPAVACSPHGEVMRS